jgi:hypothetical protein
MSQANRSISARTSARETLHHESKELFDAALWLAEEAGRESDALTRTVLLEHSLQLWQKACGR